MNKTWHSSENIWQSTRKWILSSSSLHVRHVRFSSGVTGFVWRPLSIIIIPQNFTPVAFLFIYCMQPITKWLYLWVACGNWLNTHMVDRCWPITHIGHWPWLSIMRIEGLVGGVLPRVPEATGQNASWYCQTSNISNKFPTLKCFSSRPTHYNDVIMGMIASQITSLMIVYSTVYSDADHRKHQSSISLAFVRKIHRGPVNSPHRWPVTQKMFPFDDVIMWWFCPIQWSQVLSQEWRCSWSSTDRRCSNYIRVINSFSAYKGATHIRGLTVFQKTYNCLQWAQIKIQMSRKINL